MCALNAESGCATHVASDRKKTVLFHAGGCRLQETRRCLGAYLQWHGMAPALKEKGVDFNPQKVRDAVSPWACAALLLSFECICSPQDVERLGSVKLQLTCELLLERLLATLEFACQKECDNSSTATILQAICSCMLTRPSNMCNSSHPFHSFLLCECRRFHLI